MREEGGSQKSDELTRDEEVGGERGGVERSDPSSDILEKDSACTQRYNRNGVHGKYSHHCMTSGHRVSLQLLRWNPCRTYLQPRPINQWGEL